MEALGIDLKLMIAQVINFGILFFVLSKLLYKPVTKMLEERQNKITKSIEDSEIATKKLDEAEAEAGKIRLQAYKEAEEILKNAKAEANQEAAKMIKKSSDQADRLLDNAKGEAIAIKKEALLEARKEITSVVSLALDKIVGEKLDKMQKEKLTKSSLAEL